MKRVVWIVGLLLIVVGGGLAAAQTLGMQHDHKAMLAGSPSLTATAPLAGSGATAPPAPTTGAPSAADAMGRLDRLGWVHIKKLSDFHPENGVRSGSGTVADPFVLSGFYAKDLAIEDVEAAYVIRDAYISGTLRLDYTGAGSRVESSTIGFLLTDTNREHTAPHTWLDVQGNVLGGARIRHAGGIFADNVVGTPGALAPHKLALEAQGYNGLLLTRNVVHGATEFRLHGHHYAASYDETWMGHASHMSDPAQRYHAVKVTNNVFVDVTGKGVSISDRDHEQNHGTAASEPDKRLDGAHAHHLLFEFGGNRIEGGGLVIEAPNAEDEDHRGGEATIRVTRNTIVDPLDGTGIAVRHSHGAVVDLVENDVQLTTPGLAESVGVSLKEIEEGSVAVRGGTISGFERGVSAREVKDAASWSVTGVAFSGVPREVWWDRSVAVAPTR